MVAARLVGREAELAVLVECLAAAQAGEPRVVLCRGEPGIGKTRLAEEVVAAARARGMATAWGRAAEASGAPPYWPWRQVLRALEATAGSAAVAARLGLAADLAGLAPDVFCEVAAGRPQGPPSDEDRFRQFDAVARLLRELTISTPVVAVLDDAHWADRASLLLLRHVVRGLDGERLLLLVNHRDSEGVSGADLLRERPVRDIVLRGLAATAVGQRLADVTGRQVGLDEATRVHALTGGNPFYVGETARVPAGEGHAPAQRTGDRRGTAGAAFGIRRAGARGRRRRGAGVASFALSHNAVKRVKDGPGMSQTRSTFFGCTGSNRE